MKSHCYPLMGKSHPPYNLFDVLTEFTGKGAHVQATRGWNPFLLTSISTISYIYPMGTHYSINSDDYTHYCAQNGSFTRHFFAAAPTLIIFISLISTILIMYPMGILDNINSNTYIEYRNQNESFTRHFYGARNFFILHNSFIRRSYYFFNLVYVLWSSVINNTCTSHYYPAFFPDFFFQKYFQSMYID